MQLAQKQTFSGAQRSARSSLIIAHAAPVTRQQLAAVGAAAVLLLGSAPQQTALAIGPVSVKLDGIVLTRVPCGSGAATVGGVTFSGSGSKAACLDVSAQATNPDKKPLFNADVFGRIYDANQEAMIDDSENYRVAYIDEIAPGKSEVHFRLQVPLEQYELGAPTLRGFKATGFPGGNLPKSGPGKVDQSQAEICEILGNCDDLEAEAAIR